MNSLNKSEIECRFKRSITTYDDNAYAQKMIVGHLTGLIGQHCPQPGSRILEIGCGTGLLTERIQQRFTHCELFVNDLVEAMCSKAANRCQLDSNRCIPGDIENLTLSDSYGLIVSASTFQWFTNPARTFARLADRLTEGGWMIFSTFGKDNLKELKNITGQGLVYHTIPEMTDLLMPYFEVVYAEDERYVLEFNEPIEILKHVKKTGVNGIPQESAWTRHRLEEFSKAYSERFLRNGQCPLTYHPQYFACRKTGSGEGGL